MRKLLIWFADNCLWKGKAGFEGIKLPDRRAETVRLLYERGVKQFVIGKNFNELLKLGLDHFGLTPNFTAVYGEPLMGEHELAVYFLSSIDVTGGLIEDLAVRGKPREEGFYRQAGVVLPSEIERTALRNLCPGLVVCGPEEIDGIISKEYTPDALRSFSQRLKL